MADLSDPAALTSMQVLQGAMMTADTAPVMSSAPAAVVASVRAALGARGGRAIGGEDRLADEVRHEGLDGRCVRVVRISAVQRATTRDRD